MKKFIHLNELENFNLIDGLSAKIIHTDTQTFAFWHINQGAVLPAHRHMHEQVSMVTEGELELTIEGETQLMKPGMVAVIPSNAEHSAIALTKVAITDVFTPIREDFMYKQD